MPIHGLTDRGSLQALPPCIGKLFKGDPKSGSRPGKDLDFFRFEGRIPGVAEAFARAYPTNESRRSINCRVLGHDLESAFPSWYEFYNASGTMLKRCDGLRLTNEFVGGVQQSYKDLPDEMRPECHGCPARLKDPNLPDSEKGKLCKQVGRLRIVIDELFHMGFVGFVSVETHGIHDIRELSSNLAAINLKDLGVDRISSIPFVLQRVLKEIPTPRPNGNRARDKKWLLHLLMSPEWVSSRTAVRDRVISGHDNPYILMSSSSPDPAPVRALPAPRATQPRAASDPIATIYNFYRSLALHPNHFSQHLRMDLQRAGRHYEVIERTQEADVPMVVGVRMAEFATNTGAFGDRFDDDPEKVYNRALEEARTWIKRNPEIWEHYKEGRYGAVGMAWAEHVQAIDEALATHAKQSLGIAS